MWSVFKLRIFSVWGKQNAWIATHLCTNEPRVRVHLGNIPALSTIPFPWRCWCEVRESEMKESESVEQTWGCFERRKASRPRGVERTDGHLIQEQTAKQPLDRQTEKRTDKRLFQVPNGSVHWRFKNIKEHSGGGYCSCSNKGRLWTVFLLFVFSWKQTFK